MKRLKFLMLGVLMAIPMIGSYTKGTAGKYIAKETRSNHTIHRKREVSVVLETLTVYNPVKRQCDNSPMVTASNTRIDAAKLRKQEIRWIALSRNLLKRWNGAFHYGDTVNISAGDPDIDGLWVIQDTLNKRYKNCGDLLFDSSVRKLGKWKNVTVSKVEWIPVVFSPEPIEQQSEVLDTATVAKVYHQGKRFFNFR